MGNGGDGLAVSYSCINIGVLVLLGNGWILWRSGYHLHWSSGSISLRTNRGS